MSQIAQISYIRFVTPNQLFTKPTLSSSKVTAQSITRLSIPSQQNASKKPVSPAHTPRTLHMSDRVTNADTASNHNSSAFLSKPKQVRHANSCRRAAKKDLLDIPHHETAIANSIAVSMNGCLTKGSPFSSKDFASPSKKKSAALSFCDSDSSRFNNAPRIIKES